MSAAGSARLCRNTFRQALTRSLPRELDRLRTARQAQPANLTSLPANIRREWVLLDGWGRIEVLPVASARNSAGLHRFVAEVSRLAPDGGNGANDSGDERNHRWRLPLDGGGAAGQLGYPGFDEIRKSSLSHARGKAA